jgi:hypothetical protein
MAISALQLCIKWLFKHYKRVALCVILLAILCGFLYYYPSIREGGNIALQDLGVKNETPELYNIEYDHSSKTVTGNIKGVKNAADYKIILFILTDQWYVKPDFDRYTHKGLSDLQNNERFLLDAYTPEQDDNDIKATKYVVFLVPASYSGLVHMNDYDGANAASVYSYIGVIQ